MAMGATSDGLQNIFELQKKKGANKIQVKKKKNKQTNKLVQRDGKNK